MNKNKYTEESAVELLKSSKNINDWNEKRNEIKLGLMLTSTRLPQWFYTIDTSGLIKEVKKQNNWS